MTETKVALITGGTRGLGLAMAEVFARRGWAVAVTYASSDADAAAARQRLGAAASRIEVLKADVADSAAAGKAVTTVRDEFGRIDVLINNAGIARDRKIERMSDDEWDSVIRTNLSGVFYMTRAVFPIMRDRGGGSIVNILSYMARRPAAGAANYAASKAGVSSLTESAALEGGADAIRVNAVMPGFHVTAMNERIWKRIEPRIRSQHLLATLPERAALGEFVFFVAGLETVTGQLFPFESRLL